MRRWISCTAGLLCLAFHLPAATVVSNQVPAPGAEFGAAAIRSAAMQLSLGPVVISLAKDLPPEAFRIRATSSGYAIAGGDARGAMYGALDFAEQLQLAGKVHDKEEQPSLGVRALKFNIPLPGTGYVSEEDIDR